MAGCRCDSGTAQEVDAFPAVPLGGRGRGGARYLRRPSFAPEETMIGGDHQNRAVLLRDCCVTAEETVDLAEVASGNGVVTVVVRLRDGGLLRRRERGE